jgi:acyl carrier protein
MDYLEKVKEIIKSELDVTNDSKITMDASFENDLGADSIARFELVNRLEEDFDLTIDDEAANLLTTVGAVVKFLEENVG